MRLVTAVVKPFNRFNFGTDAAFGEPHHRGGVVNRHSLPQFFPEPGGIAGCGQMESRHDLDHRHHLGGLARRVEPLRQGGRLSQAMPMP